MSNMKTLGDASRLLAKQAANIEDSAVSEFIRQQAEFLKAKGANLEDYYLVRESGNFEYKSDKTGASIKAGVYYGLKHKDEVMKVEFPDE